MANDYKGDVIYSDKEIEEKAREHASHISENYQKLLDRATTSVRPKDRMASAPVAPAPAPQPQRPPMVTREPVSNAARISEYVAHPAPAKEGKKILFDGLTYTKGGYMTGPRTAAPQERAPEAPVRERYEAPVREQYEAVAPAPYRTATAEEILRPTAETLRFRTIAEDAVEPEEEKKVHFLEALSAKMKVAIVAIAATIILAIVLVCINTAVLNSTNAEIRLKRANLRNLQERNEELDDEIGEVTSPDSIEEWAMQNGMVKD